MKSSGYRSKLPTFTEDTEINEMESENQIGGLTRKKGAKSILPNFIFNKEAQDLIGSLTGVKLTFDESMIQCYRKHMFDLWKEIVGIVVLILTQLPFFLH